VARSNAEYKDVLSAVKIGSFSPVYLLFGEEDYLVEEAAETIIAAALKNADKAFNLDVLRATDADAREIVACASAFPVVSERRVVVVREPEKLTGRDPELLITYIENPLASTVLLLVSVKPDFRTKLFATAKSRGVALEFRPLYENRIPGWITEQVQFLGKRIDLQGAKLLAACSAPSLREVRNEIDKLCMYAGERTELTVADVSAVVGMSREFTPFELQKAVGVRDAGRAIAILERLLETGVAIPLIIATLTRFFMTLSKVHDLKRRGSSFGEMAAAVHIPPFFFREIEEAINHQPPESCEQAFLLLAEADERTKSGVADPRLAMQDLVVLLCGENGRNSGMPQGV
jgi:DNA polymerase-3 subunit delta